MTSSEIAEWSTAVGTLSLAAVTAWGMVFNQIRYKKAAEKDRQEYLDKLIPIILSSIRNSKPLSPEESERLSKYSI